jgi:5-methylcytosine-specific restriction endonuclease McrA
MAYRYRRRVWYNSVPDKELPGEKTELEVRLEELRRAQADFDAFNGLVLEAERIIRAVFNDPSQRQRPFLFTFEKDPLKWPLKAKASVLIADLIRSFGDRELSLIQKWPKAYPKAKHTHIFPHYSWSETETIRRLKSLLYDVKADIEYCEKRLVSVIRRIEAPERERARRERKELERARREAILNQQRSGAQQIKVILPRNHPCPYCGGQLGSAPHADHIHPVAKGGLSTKQNMVYICMECNIRKSHMTLTAFTAMEGRDLAGILERLRALGKEF